MKDEALDVSPEEEKTMCQILEMNYLASFGRTVNDNNSDLFPINWFSNQDFNKKMSILLEAIEKKQKIINTENYQDIIEGVKNK